MKFDASNMVGQQFVYCKFLKRQLASLYTVALMFMFTPCIYNHLCKPLILQIVLLNSWTVTRGLEHVARHCSSGQVVPNLCTQFALI